MISEFTIPEDVLSQMSSGAAVSSYAVINSHEEVQELLRGHYGRAGLALKLVPRSSPKQRPDRARWGNAVLGDASLVQNLVALKGLAPRVYDLVRVNKTHAAQVTDYVVDDGDTPRQEELQQLLDALEVVSMHINFDMSPNNWRGGKFVDFSGLKLGPGAFDRLASDLRARAMVKKGCPASSAYQEVPGLNIPGDRPANRAIPAEVAALLPGRDVVDFGCNLGHFARAAVDLGARRVTGVELGETADLARLANILLGYWTIDVVQEPPTADLVMCLSAVKYLGDEAILRLAMVAPVLWLEGHGDIPADHYETDLKQHYHVERLPDSTDNKRRAQFLCRRRQ